MMATSTSLTFYPWRSLVLTAVLWSSLASGLCPVREPLDLPGARRASGTGEASGLSDNGFYLTVSGNPEHYEANSLYTVSLTGDKTLSEEKKFTQFLLVVENVGTSGTEASSHLASSSGSAGSYQLLGDVLTRFSDHCTNTVTQASYDEKNEIQVLWTAPPHGSGCVEFKATVVEKNVTWSMDSGRLTVRLCEETVEEHSVPGDADIQEPCCACEEAKYEMTFEGLWSEKTHPKDFPKERWLLHFSDIIGASHSADYRFWKYNGYATKGLAKVAKWGSPRILESELKAESDRIRTIIKARGLWYPNVNGKTFAVFRTDRNKHLVSLVSMLGPSPDWIVGVSGLELCTRNCSWVEKKESFLYPWDAGVDDGLSYMSPDIPTYPQQPITRISSRHPADPRMPFYNETGAPMRPLAKLTLTRQRLYKKSCGLRGTSGFNDDDFVLQTDNDEQRFAEKEENEGELVPGCEVSPWSPWTSCSVTCGKGISMRTRTFLSPEKATNLGCDRQTVQKEMCSASSNLACDGDMYYDGSAPEDFLPDDMCATSEWSRWSDCSTSCGKGFKARTRRFYNRMGRKKCPHVDVMEKAACSGPISECPQDSDVVGGNAEVEDPNCGVTAWSDWSPCSVTCGKGLKVRTRLYKVSPEQQMANDCNVRLMDKGSCEGERPQCQFDTDDAVVICGLEKKMGPCRGNFPRWYYNPESRSCLQFVYGGCRGNSNNFQERDDCSRLCETHADAIELRIRRDEDGLNEQQQQQNHNSHQHRRQPRVDNTTDQFDLYHGFNLGGNFYDDDYSSEGGDEGRSSSEDNEEETFHSGFADSTSDIKRKLMAAKRKMMLRRQREELEMAEKHRLMMTKEEDGVVVDCEVTAWSPWSGCSSTCGRNSFRTKFRTIKRYPSLNGKKCPRKLDRKQKCRVPVCPSDCFIGEWGEWNACSKSCGEDGVQERTREVRHNQLFHDFEECGAKVEKRVCLLSPCHFEDGM